MNKEPETYEELIRMKKCIDLADYYELNVDEIIESKLIKNLINLGKIIK